MQDILDEVFFHDCLHNLSLMVEIFKLV